MVQRFTFISLFATLLLMFITGCEKEEYIPADDYAVILNEIDGLSQEAYTADLAEFDSGEELDPDMVEFNGKRPCFVFVFPIQFANPTANTPIVINNQRELRAFLKRWKENQTDLATRPRLIFPVKVKFRDGTIMRVGSPEQLDRIREKCDQQRPELPKFRLCFDPVFPVYVSVPTQNAPVEVNSKEDLHQLLRKWKENYPESDLRPAIIFPIKIKTFRGEIIEVTSMEELKEHLKDCIRKLMRKKKGK